MLPRCGEKYIRNPYATDTKLRMRMLFVICVSATVTVAEANAGRIRCARILGTEGFTSSTSAAIQRVHFGSLALPLVCTSRSFEYIKWLPDADCQTPTARRQLADANGTSGACEPMCGLMSERAKGWLDANAGAHVFLFML